MSTWNADDLGAIGNADEIQVASNRPDGSLRPFVTIWAVRSGGELYIRSAHGTNNPWFRRAKASGTGRIRAGGIERDVTFSVPGANVHTDIDAAYHSKYDRYGPAIVGGVVGGQAAAATLQWDPL